MPAKIIPIFYLNADRTARLSHDGVQWILERSHGRSLSGRDSGFRGQSYVLSNKAILLRCIRDKRLPVDLNGRRLLAALQDSYPEFSAALEASGRTLVVRMLGQRARALPPVPYRSVKSKSAREKAIHAKRPRFFHGCRLKLAERASSKPQKKQETSIGLI